MKKTTILSLFLFLGLLNNASSQNITPDPAFGNNGIVMTDISGNGDVASDMTVQPDGKILVAGYAIPQSYKQFMVMRYNSDGSVDSAFANNGEATIAVGPVNNYCTSLALQPDGKILLAGYYGWNFYTDPAVARFNSDGSRDVTFGDSGLVKFVISNFYDEFHDVAVQPDGKIVLGGRTYENGTDNFMTMRLLADGSVDSTFGTDGKVIDDYLNSNDCIYSLIIQQNGKILVSGKTEPGSSYFAAARYLTDGTPDITFGAGGKMFISSGSRFDKCYGMAVQPDSSIVLVGTHHAGAIDEFMVVRINAQGVPDNSFGVSGIKTITSSGSGDILTDVIIQHDGKIVASGKYNSNEAMLMRLNTNGTADASFGVQGIYSGNNGSSDNALNSLYLLPDSSIIACGFSRPGVDDDFIVTKILNNVATGIKKAEPLSIPITIYPNPATTFIMVQLPLIVKEQGVMEIYNEQGKMISHIPFDGLSSYTMVNLPPQIVPGMYVLAVRYGNSLATEKFLVQ